MSICALLARLNKLNTKSRISRWNTGVNQSCVLCSNHIEDRDHLFFNCNYSRQLPEDLMTKLKIIFRHAFDIEHILTVMYHNQNGNRFFNHLINTFVTTLIWHIWCERNTRIFKGIELAVQVRNMLIIQDCKHLLQYKLDATKLVKSSNLSSPNLKSPLTNLLTTVLHDYAVTLELNREGSALFLRLDLKT